MARMPGRDETCAEWRNRMDSAALEADLAARRGERRIPRRPVTLAAMDPGDVAEGRPVRVEIDLNVRVRGNQTFAGYEDADPAGALVTGEMVIACERESGLSGDAVVTDLDPETRLIYLAVDWRSMRADG